MRKLVSRDTLINERISLDKNLLTDFYLNRGFVDFQIYDVNAELSEEKDAFFISYNLREGSQYSVGNVELKSKLTNIDLSSFHKAIKLNSGDTYSSKTIEIEVASLSNLLQIQGFNFVNVIPKITRNLRDLTIDVVFNFDQSERIFVGQIDITGNIATLDRVIRRQFFINEGDPINPAKSKQL